MTRYLLMPFHATPLILVGVFALLWYFAITMGGLLGVPFDLILVSWFFKYCYVLLDAVVAGHEELPVLSVEMLNPVDEQRPLVQAIIVSLGFIACWWVYHALGSIAGLGLGIVLLIALPATIGLLAMSESWLHALSPVAIARVVRGVSWDYIGVLAVTLGGAVLIVWLARTLDSLLLTLVLVQLVLLGIFCFVGGAIFENRVGLQLATRTHGERRAERDERHHANERAAVLDGTYSLLRMKRRNDAWATLEAWMRKHCPDTHPFTEYHALLEATCTWDDPAIGDRVANEYLAKLLVNGETGMALEALEIRLRTNPKFYPDRPNYAARLLELVTLSGRKPLKRQLIANAAAQSDSAGAKP